ncbi:hypothetical protein GCM10010038_19290 [Glutamicibacter protophormiae]|nr:hypothetical protein GCM10010038_19290 [Glutamicibacter protophormiae]
MPDLESRWESIKPAGPPPMMPTLVFRIRAACAMGFLCVYCHVLWEMTGLRGRVVNMDVDDESSTA